MGTGAEFDDTLRPAVRRRIRPAPALAPGFDFRRSGDDRHRARLGAAAHVGPAPAAVRRTPDNRRERRRPPSALGRRVIPNLEAASSDSDRTSGVAERARFSGNAGTISYDLGMLHGGTDFAGIARGTSVQDGVVSARLGSSSRCGVGQHSRLRLRHAALGRPGTTVLDREPQRELRRCGDARIRRGSAGTTTAALTPLDGMQRGLRATTSLPLGPASFSASFERGTVNADARGLVAPVQTCSRSRRRRACGAPASSPCSARTTTATRSPAPRAAWRTAGRA